MKTFKIYFFVLLLFAAFPLLGQSAEEFLKSGNQHFHGQRYNEAIRDYKKAIELDPKFSKAYNNLGNMYYALQEYEEAIKHFSKAIELSPQDAEPYCSRGALYFDLNKFKEAKTDIEKSITLNPKYAQAYRLNGSLQKQMGKKELACESWKKAAGLGHIGAYEELKKYCMDQLSASEWENIEKAVVLGKKPKNSDDYVRMGNRKLELRDYKSAQKDFMKALELNERNAEAYYGLGSTYFALADNHNACKQWHKALDLGLKKASEMIDNVCHD